jgi:hypothetical protein
LQRVDRALGDELLGEQVLAALVLALEVGQLGAVALDLGLGLVDWLARSARSSSENISSPAFTNWPSLMCTLADGGGGLRMQVDGADRGHGAVGLLHHRHVLALRRHHVDDGRAACPCPRRSAPAWRRPAVGVAVMVSVPDAAANDDDGGGDAKVIFSFHSLCRRKILPAA